MTLTESRSRPQTPGAAAAGRPLAEAPEAHVTRQPAAGLTAAVKTGDHQVIGRLFIGVSLLLAVGAAVVGALLGAERVTALSADDVFGGVNAWFQMWTLYRMALVLLVVMPLLLGLAMAVLPGQIGAGGLAFPRAALASFWAWLIGSVVVVASVFAGGGWGALDGVSPDERDAITLTVLGAALVTAALLLGAIVVAATVISLRRPGLSLLDMPPFAWSMLVTAAVWLLTLPVWMANIALVYTDLRGRAPISFGEPEGLVIWSQLDWITEQPAVYALAIPVLGIAAQVAEAVSGRRPARPEVVAASVGLFGLLSVGGWSQDFFTAGPFGAGSDHRDELVYVVFGLAALLPVVAVAGGVADSLLRGGAKSLAGMGAFRMLGAAVGLLLLAGAAFAGALRVIEPFELLERSTNTGIFNAVVVAALAAAAAGLWHWSGDVLGSAASERAGRAAAGLLAVGGVLLAGPDVVSGFLGAADLPMLAALPGSWTAVDQAEWLDARVVFGLSGAADDDAVRALSRVSFAGSLTALLGLTCVGAGALAAARRRSRRGPAADRAEASA